VTLAASVRQQAGEARHQQLLQGLQGLLESALQQHGYDTDKHDWLSPMKMDLELNAQGLGCWIDYQARQSQ
jgi:hydroxyacylglutathione hydrolase